MRFSKNIAAGVACLLLTSTLLCGCTAVVTPSPTETTAPTVAVTEADETRISKDQYDKVKENSPSFKAFMASMHHLKRGYFIKR